MYSNNNMNYNRRMNLNNTFRKLWEEHVMWTRSFIISTASNLDDLQYVTKRLLRNPVDFANELRKFYGNEKADKFQNLFTRHLLIAANLVNAAKAGNTQAADEARKEWYENADDIAAFLAGINPYWSVQEWKSLLYDHLKMTENEAAERLKGDYADDIALYDQIEDEALRMADYMASGIMKQFRI